MRHFTRTPYYTGPDDPERGEVRGTLQLSLGDVHARMKVKRLALAIKLMLRSTKLITKIELT